MESFRMGRRRFQTGRRTVKTVETGVPRSTRCFGQALASESYHPQPQSRFFIETSKHEATSAKAAIFWNLANLHFPGAVQIVDLYHARQQPFFPRGSSRDSRLPDKSESVPHFIGIRKMRLPKSSADSMAPV